MFLVTGMGGRGSRFICMLFATAVLAGCDSTDDQSAVSPEEKATVETATSSVLAEVNGSPITEADVALTIDRTFSDAEKINADAGLHKKVLDSLVASRAMRQQAEKLLDADEIEHIRGMARAYEEELFVKAYLKAQTEPQPVTSAQVEAYYRKHPERFGSVPLRSFELLKAPANLDEEERSRLLSAIPKVRKADDWSRHQANWKTQYHLHYKAVKQAQPGLMDAPLEAGLERLEEGETSEVIYIDGQTYLLRLNQVAQSPAKPLSEVSGEIRTALAPLQLRAAVRDASEQARSEADIRYLEQ